jgi:hypothetical protein
MMGEVAAARTGLGAMLAWSASVALSVISLVRPGAMPILLCPMCGENDLVPLAFCEWFIEDLPYLTPSGCGTFIVAARCARCLATRNETQRSLDPKFRAGEQVALKQALPRLLIDPRNGDAVPSGSSVTIVEPVDCKDEGLLYLVRTLSGIETCVVPEWLQQGN